MRGGQWQVLRLIEGLRGAGINAKLLSPQSSPLHDKARARNLDVEALTLWAIHRHSRRVDVVHAHDARAHTLAAALGPPLSRVPLVVSRRVAFPVRSRWKYRRASRYAAVSQFVKDILMQGGVAEERISVVYDGVPLGEPGAGGETVVAPASGDPRKATALAIEATRRAEVDVLLSRDLEADLVGAGLFLYLTHSEGLGSAILMAMAAGVPVVASDVGGIPEIVRHRENGWLVRNEPEAVAAAIRELLSDHTLARTLAARARETVAEKFSLDQMIHSTIDIYRQVLAC